MKQNRLHIELRGKATRLNAATRRVLATRLRCAMRGAGLEHAELSLSLSDDRELHALNLRYANEDHATDVLSFAQADSVRVPAQARHPLGDIVISVEYARRQAKRGLPAELFHLAVHGLVHLLGFDHRDAAEERVMFGYEAALRAYVLARSARRPKRPRAARRPAR